MAAALCGLTEWALDAYGRQHRPRVGRAVDTAWRMGWVDGAGPLCSKCATEQGTPKRLAEWRATRRRRAAAGLGVLFVMLFVCLSDSARLVNPVRAGGRNATNSSADGQARTPGTGSGHHGIAFIPIKHSSVDCKVCPCGQTGFTLP